MNDLEKRLLHIRAVMEPDWQQSDGSTPLPLRDAAFEERLERVLNQSLSGTRTFDHGMKEAIDRSLFELKYYWFFRRRYRRFFLEVLENVTKSIAAWAGRKLRG